MATSQVDYISVFQNVPVPVLLLTTDLTVMDVNRAHLRLTGRSRDDLLGVNVLDAFPDNPAEPGIAGTSSLRDSVLRAVETGRPDVMGVQRYDVEATSKPGTFEERYWCPVNTPVRGPGGEVEYVIHVVEEVSDLIRRFVEAEAAGS